MKNIALQGSNVPAPESELIFNPDGSIYHLKLHKHQIAPIILVVGDQNRVAEISKLFDKIDHQVSNREFVTHTGTYKNKQITALSTGIGTDNIDIVVNELDALVNFDFSSRTIHKEKTSLTIVRIGTSGSLQKEIPVDSAVVSKYALGFDGVLPFYQFENTNDEKELLRSFLLHSNWSSEMNPPYAVSANADLFSLLEKENYSGITATANGFYGPQGRVLRLSPKRPDLNELFLSFNWHQQKITNYEMETSALFGLCSSLGHKACTICAIIANRYTKTYSKDHHATLNRIIGQTLDRLTT